MNIRALIREPLLHFLFAGALLFAWYELSGGAEAGAGDGRVIEVDREALLTFMQYRARAFEPELFRARLEAMSPGELRALVEDYVREEVLYREALSLAMDEGDYIIRQRLVQKLDFLLEDAARQAADPGPEELDAFYQERRDDYLVDAVYTFTHIFFDAEKRGWDEARAAAAALLQGGETASLPFTGAGQYGDRYPFLQNYVERTRDYVANNFNDDFVAALDAIEAPGPQWRGPFASRYGYHLVMLRARTEPYIPQLEAIRERVLEDFRFESALRAREEAVDRLISDYEVRIDL